jgi:molecular chaperone DnaK (HSP70)
LIAPGEVAARPLLPSVRYHPAEGELAAADVPTSCGPSTTPAGCQRVLGELARERGAQVPGRLVASAKSWLSHAGVDRTAPILPWGAAEEIPKVSPVAASASYLAHVQARPGTSDFPDASRWSGRNMVLTVPASFDEAARSADAGSGAAGRFAGTAPAGRAAGRLP